MNNYERKHNAYLRENGGECTVLLKKDGCFPLEKAEKIAVYGSGARNTVKGGTGSGEVNSRFFVTIEQGLTEAGFVITSGEWLDSYDKVRAMEKEAFVRELKAEAKAKHQNVMIMAMGRTMAEPTYDLPVDAPGDTAVYVLSRLSGEGSDRVPVEGDILLSKTEIRDIKICNEKYRNFMLVINAGGVVDLSPVADVKNILIFSQLGVESGHILADILLGKQSPSGRLTTTWSAWEDYPVIGDFGERDDTSYKEGIYVGYRYFDTVGKQPLFPFGYGLTYSDFVVKAEETVLVKDVVTVSIRVENTGKYRAKEVVQLYLSIPEGRLDEPYQVLCGFTKTRTLAPGDEEIAKICFRMRDIAPYDAKKAVYVLEPGEYILRVGNSSRNTQVCGRIRIREEIIVRQVKNILGNPGFQDYVPAKGGVDKPGDMLMGVGGTIHEYHVAEADSIGGKEDRVPEFVLAAEDIETETIVYGRQTETSKKVESLPDEMLVKLNLGAFNPKGGVSSIIGNAGFTVAGAAGQSTLDGEEYGIGSLVMADGPAGVRVSQKYAQDIQGGVHSLGNTMPESIAAFMPGPMRWLTNKMGYKLKKTDVVKEQYATALPIGTAIAQSFNVDFAQECGKIVGTEMKLFGINLWLAPALNIHRSIQCGRNFEYFSEDPLVGGLMAGYLTRGVQSCKGCGTTIKHFAFNNQERNRTQNNSCLSERAAREIYLKGFKIAVEVGRPKAVMTSYNLVNGIHTNEHRGLVEDVLRAEFGFQGIVMTDWIIAQYKSESGTLKYPPTKPEKVCMAGGDLLMPGSKSDYEQMLRALKNGGITRKQLVVNATRVVNMIEELCETE